MIVTQTHVLLQRNAMMSFLTTHVIAMLGLVERAAIYNVNMATQVGTAPLTTVETPVPPTLVSTQRVVLTDFSPTLATVALDMEGIIAKSSVLLAFLVGTVEKTLVGIHAHLVLVMHSSPLAVWIWCTITTACVFLDLVERTVKYGVDMAMVGSTVTLMLVVTPACPAHAMQ